eukprot:317196-Amphidinium_carterae.1
MEESGRRSSRVVDFGIALFSLAGKASRAIAKLPGFPPMVCCSTSRKRPERRSDAFHVISKLVQRNKDDMLLGDNPRRRTTTVWVRQAVLPPRKVEALRLEPKWLRYACVCACHKQKQQAMVDTCGCSLGNLPCL